MIDPFLFAMIVIVGLVISGLSVGLAMMCGSFLYLMLKGYDPSIDRKSVV